MSSLAPPPPAPGSVHATRQDPRLRKASDYARLKLDHLRSRTLGLMEVLYSLQSLHALLAMSRQPMEAEIFQRFVNEPMERHPELQALAWSPLVYHANRSAFEERMRDMTGDASFNIRDLDPHTHLRTAAVRDTYVPLTFLAPLAANTIAQGFDLASEPRRKLALQRARDSGEPFTTSPLRLVQETENQLGCLVVLPVYAATARTEEERRKQLLGFVTAAFRISDMVETFLQEEANAPWRVEVAVFDKSDAAQLVCRRGPDLPDEALDTAIEWLEFAGARWRVRVPLDDHLFHSPPPLPTAEQRYRNLFENAVVGMFQTSPAGRYLAANRAMAHLYGYTSPDELITALSDISTQLYVEPTRRAEFVQLLQRHDTISGFESQVRRLDGSLIWISEKARAVRDTDGHLLHYEGIVEDITEQRHARESLNRACSELQQRLEERSTQLARSNTALSIEIEERKRAEKAAETANQAKSVFLSHMSHEIRTPLNAVIGYTQILQRDQNLTAEQRQAIQALAAGSDHLMSLVDNLLDLSKIESGSMEVRQTPFHLHDMVGLLESMFRHRCQQKRLALHVDCTGAGAHVVGDEGMLRQVLINLLSNAVKFTDLGHVSLTVIQTSAEHWSFEVADTGMGIDPTLQAQIFQPFQQGEAGRERGGTGLGLTILKRQIELMGGILSLDSAPERGSRFSFTLLLPPSGQARPTAEPIANIQLKPGATARALVVDDVAENRDLLSRMLRMTGCHVDTAENGLAALESARQSPPDIVFMDIWMPEMNGIEATQHLLHEFRKRPIKVVAHSASAFTHEARKYLETGFEDFFPKPFRFERLCSCLHALLPDRFMPVETTARTTPAFSLASLPAPFAQRLRQTAENYNITALKQCVEELRTSSDEGAEAARELNSLIARYDMEGVITFIHQHLTQPS